MLEFVAGQRGQPGRPTATLPGEAATKAAAEDGQESPPPNDYYIRNVNALLRTLPVRSDAPITVKVLAAGSTGSATKDVAVTLAELASYFPNSGTAPFRITVDQGQVTKAAQQYCGLVVLRYIALTCGNRRTLELPFPDGSFLFSQVSALTAASLWEREVSWVPT